MRVVFLELIPREYNLHSKTALFSITEIALMISPVRRPQRGPRNPLSLAFSVGMARDHPVPPASRPLSSGETLAAV